MKLVNLREKPLEHRLSTGADIAIERLVLGTNHPYTTPNTASNLRFFFSPTPLELGADGKTTFVSERAAIKVHPDVPISFGIEEGAELYVVNFLANEATYLVQLERDNSEFFAGWEGPDKDIWDKVRSQDLDYVLDGEKNAEHMIKLDGVVIAPTHSRWKPMSVGGWQLREMRASRAVGIASGYERSVRGAEKSHSHAISSEFYLVIDGSMGLSVDGREHILAPGDIAIVEPGEEHYRTKIQSARCAHSTMQMPALGDKIEG